MERPLSTALSTPAVFRAGRGEAADRREGGADEEEPEVADGGGPEVGMVEPAEEQRVRPRQAEQERQDHEGGEVLSYHDGALRERVGPQEVEAPAPPLLRDQSHGEDGRDEEQEDAHLVEERLEDLLVRVEPGQEFLGLGELELERS